MIRVSWRPLTPVAAITSLAMKSLNGSIVEKWRRPTLSGCSSATCSMSMPPTGEKINTGLLRRPSHTTPA